MSGDYVSYYSCYYPTVCCNRSSCRSICDSCSYCSGSNHRCIEPTPPVPTVSYVTTLQNNTNIAIDDGNFISSEATSFTSLSLTTITGYGSPVVNVGGITYDNTTNTFVICLSGKYIIDATLTFVTNGNSANNDIVFAAYKVEKVSTTTFKFTLLAASSIHITASSGNGTASLSATADLKSGDRILFGAFRTNPSDTYLPATVVTPNTNRFSIIRA